MVTKKNMQHCPAKKEIGWSNASLDHNYTRKYIHFVSKVTNNVRQMVFADRNCYSTTELWFFASFFMVNQV